MVRNVSEKYLMQQIMSASPAGLVAMLYDRAIGQLNEAVRAIEAGELERRWKANSKATEIIAHLWETLDLERGGEIATNLNRLYGFMVMRLNMVDLENDPQAARDVIQLLEPLRRSWQELAERDQGGAKTAPDARESQTTQISVSA